MNSFNKDNVIIEFKNVSKIFKSRRGISDISFSVYKGDIVGLIGNNGAGKTTLLKTLFNEYKIDRGEIFINNIKMKLDNLKGMAFFPDQNNFPKHFNIIEFAKFSAELKNISPKEYNDTLEKLIIFLNLQDLRKSRFDQLSSGQQKRALLLSVLITNPKIITFDEPTANLDVDSRIEFHNIIFTLAKELDICIVITSHIIDEMENLINKAILIKNGKIVYDDKYSIERDGKLEDLYKKHITINHEKSDSKSYDSSKLKNIFSKSEDK
ncbi:ABC transporter ATP-binding protein [Spiroplasma sp. TIUS-1]|uniref:ABC transporter ATP-binding protein n=1 Tax=Spiroplasma sp. TIUS-1 TaxID=216963 RepID=UPI0013972470|nr:ABC transporter ATP-binding protein [Spiroplasma sp. TIUS-1]QHX36079.1 ABC transporter ATP-binding protein [Spiroplasma sp. TIUS-1]